MAVAEEIICELAVVPELHVDRELSKVCCPFTTFKVDKQKRKEKKKEKRFTDKDIVQLSCMR